MKRRMGALALAAAGCGFLGGGSANAGAYMSQVWSQNSVSCSCGAYSVPTVPGFVGPYGQPVQMAAPYNAAPPTGAGAAQAMLRQNVPLEFIQAAGMDDPRSNIMQAQYCGPGGCAPRGMSPPGVPAPGGFPGQGPGAGQTPPGFPGQGPGAPPGAVAAVGALTGAGGHGQPPIASRTSVRFTGPQGLKISWFAPTADGKAGFSQQYLTAPGRYNFLQGAIYRLKITDLPHRAGVDLYPTLEVVPTNEKTAAFLAHSSVPVTFTEDDFEQVAAGNYLVKVVYLPDPRFQDLAATGVDEVISSRLDPGVDPIAEAHRRGSILLIVRLGNIDLELPNSPAMDAPPPMPPQMPVLPPPQAPQLPLMPGGRIPPGLLQPPGGPQQPPAFLPGGPGGLPPAGPVGKVEDKKPASVAKIDDRKQPGLFTRLFASSPPAAKDAAAQPAQFETPVAPPK